jgi:hypothetical protein
MTEPEPEAWQVSTKAAEVYESCFVPAIFDAWAGPVADAAGIRRGDRVLDVGCGTGVLAREALGRVGQDGQVVGLDRGITGWSRRFRDSRTGCDRLRSAATRRSLCVEHVWSWWCLLRQRQCDRSAAQRERSDLTSARYAARHCRSAASVLPDSLALGMNPRAPERSTRPPNSAASRLEVSTTSGR